MMFRKFIGGVLFLTLATSCAGAITSRESPATTAVAVTGTTQAPEKSPMPATTSTHIQTTKPSTTVVEPIAIPISRVGIEAWADELAAIPPAYVDAFNSHDLNAIRLLLADDFSFRDVGVPSVEGIDAFAGLMGQMFQAELKDMRWQLLSDFEAGFVGGDGGLMVLKIWGFFGVTEENADLALYRLATDDDQIVSIDLFYRVETPHDAIVKYAAAWSSGDPTRLEAIYDPAITRRDTVFGNHIEGVDAVRLTAGDFFAYHPNTLWEIEVSFEAVNSQGAIFSVTDEAGCPVRVAVLIDLDDGTIIREEAYYEAAALLECAWLG